MCLNHQFANFSHDKANAFSDRMIAALNEGAVCLMTSIGHRTGLFDVLAADGPGRSEVVAKRADLDERYVREWLDAMTVGKVLDYDPASQQYSLPEEHSAFLTRASSPDNMAVFAQYIPLMGAVESDVVRCFKEGGGVPYERFERFHEVMSEDSGQTVLPALFEHILPLAPGLEEKLQQGINVLDVGCGRGRALNLMAARFPNSQFTGYDLSREAVTFGRDEAQAQGLGNVRFEERDVTCFDQEAAPAQFDLITTFDAVHDQANPQAVLKGIYQSLSDDGIYLMQDIHGSSHVENNYDHPVGPLLYALSTMHCMTVSLAQGGEGLGTMWGREKACELLSEAGFRDVNVQQLAHDFQNDYYVIQK